MKNTKNGYRHTVQILFFIVITTFALNHVLSGEGIVLLPFLPDVSLHAVCPFGGIESMLSLVTAGTLVAKITGITLILSASVLLMTLVLGPVFCSYICPLGAVQEWIGKLGRRIFGKRYNTFVPKKLHHVLKYLRYVSLGLVVWLTYSALKLVFAEVDPYFAMYHFFTDKAAIGGMIVLGLTLVGSLFVERPWCKYLCPYGALLGLVGKLSPFKIRRSASACTDCARCDSVCPMNIDISEKQTVHDALCIRCMDCAVDATCRKGSLVYTARRGASKEQTLHPSPEKCDK